MELINQLVMLRLPYQYGKTNTWWKIINIYNGKFMGRLVRCPWDYEEHKIDEECEFDIFDIQSVYMGGEFCYSDNVTICDCSGLCRNK